MGRFLPDPIRYIHFIYTFSSPYDKKDFNLYYQFSNLICWNQEIRSGKNSKNPLSRSLNNMDLHNIMNTVAYKKLHPKQESILRINRITIVFFLLIAFLLQSPSEVYAIPSESLYVSLSGSDNNPGTETQPFRTIQHAVDSVDPGETIFVMGGVYNESVKINRSGTSTNPITNN